jgi:glycosyltransferase involved in cell wall biosynthesis
LPNYPHKPIFFVFSTAGFYLYATNAKAHPVFRNVMPPTSQLTVAWISDFPIEWLPDIPEPLRDLPRQHPATWQMVLLAEFEKNPSVCVHVIILRKNIERSFSFQRNGVTFHLLKYPGGTRRPSLFWLDTLLIRRALRKIKPDVVHAWGSEEGASTVATRLGYPYLITVQGLFTLFTGTNPVDVSANGKFTARMESRSLSAAKHVTAESKFSAAYVKQRYPHLSVHHIEYAPNWVFHQVQRQPATAPIRFLTNGTIGYRKGTDLLLKALDEVTPDFPFEVLIHGDPNEVFTTPLLAGLSPELRRRVSFKSHLPLMSDIARELSLATLFLMPSRAETGPLAVKEAVAAGVPVIGSTVGGIPDYVIPGENGFLFESENHAEFVAMIRAAVAHPLFSRGLVTPASLEKQRDYLSPARMAQRFLSVYQTVKNGGAAS